MSTDTILKVVARGDGRPLDPEEERQRWSLDNLCTKHWRDGHVSGARAAVSWLETEAVESFRQGRDEEAKILREKAAKMAKELVHSLKRQAEIYEQDHPPFFLEPVKGRKMATGKTRTEE